jgi:hypothetical protein
MIIVAGLLAFKVTAFFFRILLIGVVLLGLFLVLSPLLGTA